MSVPKHYKQMHSGTNSLPAECLITFYIYKCVIAIIYLQIVIFNYLFYFNQM